MEVDQGLRFPGVDYLRQKVVDKASDSGRLLSRLLYKHTQKVEVSIILTTSTLGV